MSSRKASPPAHLMGAFAVNAELRGAWRQRCAVVKHSLPCVSGSSLALQSFRHVSCPGARDGSGRSCGDAAHVQDLKRHSEHPADAMADAVGYKSFHTFFFSSSRSSHPFHLSHPLIISDRQ